MDKIISIIEDIRDFAILSHNFCHEYGKEYGNYYDRRVSVSEEDFKGMDETNTFEILDVECDGVIVDRGDGWGNMDTIPFADIKDVVIFDYCEKTNDDVVFMVINIEERLDRLKNKQIKKYEKCNS